MNVINAKNCTLKEFILDLVRDYEDHCLNREVTVANRIAWSVLSEAREYIESNEIIKPEEAMNLFKGEMLEEAENAVLESTLNAIQKRQALATVRDFFEELQEEIVFYGLHHFNKYSDDLLNEIESEVNEKVEDEFVKAVILQQGFPTYFFEYDWGKKRKSLECEEWIAKAYSQWMENKDRLEKEKELNDIDKAFLQAYKYGLYFLASLRRKYKHWFKFGIDM